MRKVVFGINAWHVEENKDEDELIFHISGRTADGKSVYIKVPDFPLIVYLEIPRKMKVNKNKADRIFEYIKKIMKDKAPMKYKLCKKRSLKYFRAKTYMALTFRTVDACRTLDYKTRRAWDTNFGYFPANYFKVHEQNIDPIIKLTVSKKISTVGWIEAEELIFKGDEELDEDERKFSSCDIDMYASWRSLTPVPEPKEKAMKKIICFDIETYSRNHNSKLPDPTMPENEIFQISFNEVVGMGESGWKIKNHLLSLKNCPPIEDTDVRNFETERDLLLGFTDIMHEIDPDIIVSYNGLKFDWNYLIIRAELTGAWKTRKGQTNFCETGRVIGVQSFLREPKWESSAYGKQVFKYLESHGRLDIDLLIEMQRNYKFDSYSLNFVAEHFLGEKKEDVSPKQMFKLYQFILETEAKLQGKIDEKILREIKRIIKQLVRPEDLKGVVRDVYRGIQAANINNIDEAIRRGIWFIGVYCVKDSILPLKLIEKLNTLIGLEQMADITGVPISYLIMKGQQIKVLAQLYKETCYKNIVIEHEPKKKGEKTIGYQGATVIEANAGDYNNVAMLDFASLYPTTAISCNICYTTLVPTNIAYDPETMYRCKWEDHVGCDHDPKKRKRDKKKILCAKHDYRFYKPHVRKGVSPKIMRNLLIERKRVKGELKEVLKKLDKDPDNKELQLKSVVLDKLQLALKVSANSYYGFFGAENGYVPLREGAASITAMGRNFIQQSIDYALERYPFSRLVYGDTDSMMLIFVGKTTEQTFDIADLLSKQITDYLKRKILDIDEDAELSPQQLEDYISLPMDLEPEAIYGRFLLLTKKRYIAYIIDRNDKIKKVVKKGVVMARRDNCHYLRDVYGEIVTMILDNKSKKEIMHTLYDQCNMLFQRKVPAKKLVLYKGFKSYEAYKIDQNLTHVILARRMRDERGEIVPANTRLEYLFLDTGKDEKHQGNKAEDFTYYKDNKVAKKLRIDSLYYLEKQLSNPLSELIRVKFPTEEYIYYKTFKEEVEAEMMKVNKDNEMIRRLFKVGNMRDRFNLFMMLDKGKRDRDTLSKIGFMLCKKKNSPTDGLEMMKLYDREKHRDVMNAIKRWRADDIMIKIYNKYGLKKRLQKRPKKDKLTIPKDEKFMKEFHVAHRNYKEVVNHLDEIFSGITFEN